MEKFVWSGPQACLRASSPIWASEASLARTRERGAEAARSRVFTRLASLAQIGELAGRLARSLPPQYKRLEIFASLRSCIFARLRRITFKLNKFTNQVLGAFSLSCACQKLKKPWNGLFMDKTIIITSHWQIHSIVLLEKQKWDCLPTTCLGTKTWQTLKGAPS